MYGEVQSISQNMYGTAYQAIKNINLLLEEVGSGTLPVEFQETLKAQALFFRAKHYLALLTPMAVFRWC